MRSCMRPNIMQDVESNNQYTIPATFRRTHIVSNAILLTLKGRFNSVIPKTMYHLATYPVCIVCFLMPLPRPEGANPALVTASKLDLQ